SALSGSSLARLVPSVIGWPPFTGGTVRTHGVLLVCRDPGAQPGATLQGAGAPADAASAASAGTASCAPAGTAACAPRCSARSSSEWPVASTPIAAATAAAPR